MRPAGTIGLLSVLALIAAAYIGRWWGLERVRSRNAPLPDGTVLPGQTRKPRLSDALVGFVTNFFLKTQTYGVKQLLSSVFVQIERQLVCHQTLVFLFQ